MRQLRLTDLWCIIHVALETEEEIRKEDIPQSSVLPLFSYYDLVANNGEALYIV